MVPKDCYRRVRVQAGSALVEFGLVLPLLLLLLLGIVEFSVALFDKAMITNASREAARAGIVYKSPPLTPAQVSAVASNYLQNALVTFGSANTPQVTVSQTSGTSSGDPLTVTVSYTYAGLALGPLISPLTGSMQLAATTTMLYE
jgi:Flp pilus assembly protein TadG